MKKLFLITLLIGLSPTLGWGSGDVIILPKGTGNIRILTTPTSTGKIQLFTAPPIVSSTYILDTFTDANGTNLTAHTMDIGSGWRADANSIKISSNRAVFDTASAIYSTDAGHTDGTLTATVNGLGSGGHDAVVCRFLNTSNYFLIYWSVATFFIYEDGATLRASGNFGTSITAGTDYPLTVTVSGSSLSATLNGLNLTYTMTTHLSETRWGIYTETDGTQQVDDFKVVP